jgi:predicted PurR-regulated permease PerM
MAVLASPQLLGWIAIAAAAGFLVWLLSPIFAPFLLAAILTYSFDPLVERLTRRRVPRTRAVGLRHVRTAYIASPLQRDS